MKRTFSTMTDSDTSSASSKETLSKRAFSTMMKRNDPNPPPFTMTSLPDSMFHLGNNIICSVVTYKSLSRVHIRKYTEDRRGILRPTKEGISLPPQVWYEFTQSAPHFCHYSNRDRAQVVGIDLIMVKNQVQRLGQAPTTIISLQRLAQGSDFTVEVCHYRVLLHLDEVHRLCDHADVINEELKSALLSYTLGHNVHSELIKNYAHLQSDPFTSEPIEGTLPVTEALGKALHGVLDTNIITLLNCLGCENQFTNPDCHSCVNVDRESCFLVNHVEALFCINWAVFAKSFVREYHTLPNFYTLMFEGDFFSCLNVVALLKSVKDSYVAETPTLNTEFVL